jgi:hypothetical protein
MGAGSVDGKTMAEAVLREITKYGTEAGID